MSGGRAGGTGFRSGSGSATAALIVTAAVGGLVFVALMIGAAAVYDAVTEADGVAGLDRPILNWAIAARTPFLETGVTAFTNLGTTLPMVLIGGARCWRSGFATAAARSSC